MKRKKQSVRFRMDHSGMIHMATLRSGKANIFRLSVTLNEAVQPEMLQEAFRIIAPRFPTLVAGVESGFLRHYVVPCETLPVVTEDNSPLHDMTPETIRSCAMRVLYRKDKIITEFFHSLTDGYGGTVFLKALLAEYLHLTHGISLPEETEIPLSSQLPQLCETTDSFSEYRSKKRRGFNRVRSYQPSGTEDEPTTHITTGIFDVNLLLQAAHRYQMTLTSFLTTVMAEALMELQQRQKKPGKKAKPIQILVPVNLRKIFPSRTLRNFSLYALPCVRSEDSRRTFPELANHIHAQIQQQLSVAYLRSMIETTAALEHNAFLRLLPLHLKCIGLRIGFRLCGSRTSSLTLSNLGQFQFPEPMRPFIRHTDFILSPRTRTPYNCGVVSCNGKLHINFTRSCKNPELERIFFRKLSEKKCIPEIQTDGKKMEFLHFLQKPVME